MSFHHINFVQKVQSGRVICHKVFSNINMLKGKKNEMFKIKQATIRVFIYGCFLYYKRFKNYANFFDMLLNDFITACKNEYNTS